MGKTTISWTQETWNPVRGCSPVSPGCKNCYAERQGGRFAGPGRPFDGFIQIGKNGDPGPRWTGKVELIPHMLDIPLKRRKPTMYFVNSMSDLFHEELPDHAIGQVFAVMAQAKQHTFQVLTKRAGRMREWFDGLRKMADDWAPHTKHGEFTPSDVLNFRHMHSTFGRGPAFPYHPWPFPNVWLGVSVEDRARRERIDYLRETPAAVRFLSLEPLLEDLGTLDLRGIDWCIVGGESGPGARPCELAWIRSIVDQCAAAGVACFVKQLGADPYLDVASTDRRGLDPTTGLRIWPHSQTLWQGCEAHTKLKDRKGGDPNEWPVDLRVRQMPGDARA